MKKLKSTLLLGIAILASILLSIATGSIDTTTASYATTIPILPNISKTKTPNNSAVIISNEPLNKAKNILEKAIALRELTLMRYANSLKNTEILSRLAYGNLMYEIINARQGLASLEITVNSAETFEDILNVPAQIYAYGVYHSMRQQMQLYESAVAIHKRLSHLLNLQSTVEAAVAALVVSKPNLAGIQSTYLNFSNNLTTIEQNINGVLNTIAGINTSLAVMTQSQLSLSVQLINSANLHLAIAKSELHKILSAISTESINLDTNHVGAKSKK